MNENEEVVVNKKEVSENSEESYEDSRRMITRTARFSMNEEAAVRKKIKTCNEEPLLVKLEKGNNLRIFCSTTAFEGVKQIIENTVSKINKIEYIRNEDQEGKIYSESIRVREKESRRNQVIYTVNIYRTKSSLLINGPQMQKFILEVIRIVQLWALENNSEIDISDQKLKKVLSKLKIEQQLLNKIEGQESKQESDDDNKAKAFDFESQKSEVKVGKKRCKKGEESGRSVREGKEKGVKETESFMMAEEENLTEISEDNKKISWSSNTEKNKEANSLDNTGVTSRTEPIVNYQEGQNRTKKDHNINNVTPRTCNTIMINNEITKEVYIDKPERAKPNSSSNHNTDESNIHLAKLKQEIKIKHTEQEASRAEIMKGVVGN